MAVRKWTISSGNIPLDMDVNGRLEDLLASNDIRVTPVD
jgi:hypothetical protein